MPVSTRVIAGAAVVLAAALVAVWFLTATQPSSPSVVSGRLPTGSEARLLSEFGSVTLAADVNGLTDYRNALDKDTAARTDANATAMRSSGRISQVPSGTRATVLEYDVLFTRVRVLDGPLTGTEGWVYPETVAPARRP